MSQFQLVLDDALFEFLCKIKNGTIATNELNDRTISNFFKLYRPSLTNKAQLDRLRLKGVIDEHQYKNLHDQVVKMQGLHDLDLSELAKKHTKLKIVLTENKTLVGDTYVNIHDTIFDAHYVICKKSSESRGDLHSILSHVFSSSTSMTICDLHIPNNQDSFMKFLNLVPKGCTIHCNSLCESTLYPSELKKLLADIKKHHSTLKIKPDKLYQQNKLHDRYIKIGNDLEIILSSGIDYLFNDKKEITCIFRSLK